MAHFLLYSPLILVAFALGEGLFLHFVKKQRYNWRLALTSAVHFGVKALVPFLVFLEFGQPIAQWLYDHRLFDGDKYGLSFYLVLFLVVEFFFYWTHRACHRIRWFWLTHSVHHVAKEMNLAMGTIQPWTVSGLIFAGNCVMLPGILFGFRPEVYWIFYTTDMALQTWIHNPWIKKLGWLEYVFNTPSHHRVHHAVNPEYRSGNYGGLLIIYDRLFGTLVVERTDVPCVYGVRGRPHSYNPFVVQSREWIYWFQEFARIRSARQLYNCFIGQPDAPIKLQSAKPLHS